MVKTLERITTSPYFSNFIVGLILLSSILVGLETYPAFSRTTTIGHIVYVVQDLILWSFAIEALLKIGACGSRPWRYFSNPWNVFDFAIVAVCFMPFQVQFLAVFRLARILRTLRLITVLPRLQRLVGALLRAIPSLGYVGVLLMLHFYVYAVTGTMMFGENDPIRFGTLHQSMLTLFQVLTLEGWNDVLATQVHGSDVGYDDAWKELVVSGRVSQAMPMAASIYFVSFIVLGTMVMLNLFTGVIISSMEDAQSELEGKPQDPGEPPQFITLREELANINRQMTELASLLHDVRTESQQRLPAGDGGPGAGSPAT